MRHVLTRDAMSPLNGKNAIGITCAISRLDSVERVEPIEGVSPIAFVLSRPIAIY